MAKFRINQKHDECIGCGSCESVCDNWKMADDGKAYPQKKELDEIGCNKEAVEICPTQCIEIIEEK